MGGGGGGGTKLEWGGGGGACELQKGRGAIRFGHAEGGGGTTSFEVVLTRELEVLAIVIGGCKKFPFHPLKGGGGGRNKFYPVLRGGGGGVQTVLDPRFFHVVNPPSP